MSYVDLSLRQIAAETRVTRDTVRRLVNEAKVDPAGRRGGHPVYRLRDVLDLIYSDERVDPESMPPVLRDAWYRGEQRRLDIRKKEGDLCDTSITIEHSSLLAQAVLNHLESLPARRSHEIAGVLGVGVGDVSAILTRVIREELIEVSDDLDDIVDRFEAAHGGVNGSP